MHRIRSKNKKWFLNKIIYQYLLMFELNNRIRKKILQIRIIVFNG